MEIEQHLFLGTANVSLSAKSQTRFNDRLMAWPRVFLASTVLYTEDLQGGWNVDGLRVVNPFA